MNAEDAMNGLYRRLIEGWNAGDAGAMAGALAPDGLVIGFDGSQMFGSGEVETELGRIFADHQTAAYVTKVRSVTPLGADAALLHAVAGMVSPEDSQIMPDRNSIQTVVGRRGDDGWRRRALPNDARAVRRAPRAQRGPHPGAGRASARLALGGMGTFAVTRERFNQWDWSRDMREQDNWDAHAAFMDELTAEGFIVLGGPVGDGRRVLLIVEAADEASIEKRLAADPWTGTLLRTERIEPWEILLRGRRFRRRYRSQPK